MAKTKNRRRLKQGTKATAQPRGEVTLKGDMGARGPANRARASKVAPAMEPNPNGISQMKFYDMLEVYHGRGWISDRGFEAGKKLRAAWETTQKGMGNDWSKPMVDSTPKPDAAVAVMVDRVSALKSVSRHVPAEDRQILHAVACEGLPIGRVPGYSDVRHDEGKAHLRDALDRLAWHLGC